MLAERIKQTRCEKGFSRKDAAEHLGVALRTYASYENGEREPNSECLSSLSKLFGVTVDYLLGLSDNPSVANELPEYNNIFKIQTHKIPLLGEIACGQPIFASEDRESYVEVGTDVRADFCLKAKGDSMINARILDGDIVFIREQPMVENGEIAAVIIDDEATLKRVYYYQGEGKLVLQAENPSFAPLMYVGEELNNIRILGKAIAFQSDVK